MKTKSVLDKYAKILSGILRCEADEIKFFINKKEVGEILYQKPPDQGGTDDDTVVRDWSVGNFMVKQGNATISTFRLYQMPHCCAIMVSCNVIVEPNFRNKRIGTILNTFRQDIGRLLGYSAVMCTDIESNVNQRKLLATNGWRDIYNVVNKRTSNRVFVSVVNI